MPIRQKFKHRSSDVSWTLAYALYLLMSVGLIIASEITVRYGGRFFGDVNAPVIYPSAEAETGQTQASTRVHRDHALARSGVVGSVGIALGSVALILIIVTFVVHQIFDYRSINRNATSEFQRRWTLTIVSSVLNFLLCAGNIALCVGSALTANAIRQYTTADESSAPNYLLGCSVMAALSGSAAAATIVVDNIKYRGLQKIVEDEEREVEVEMDDRESK